MKVVWQDYTLVMKCTLMSFVYWQKTLCTEFPFVLLELCGPFAVELHISQYFGAVDPIEFFLPVAIVIILDVLVTNLSYDGISDHASWNEVFHYWDTKLLNDFAVMRQWYY